MARGRPVVIIQAASVLAFVVASSGVAYGQMSKRPKSGLSLPGLNLGLIKVSPTTLGGSGGGASIALPGVSVAGVATVSPTTVNLSKTGVSATLPSANVANLATVSSTSLSASRSGVSATVSGVNVANAVTVSPTTASVSKTGLSATLPSANMLGTAVVSAGALDLGPKGVAVTVPGVTVGSLVNLTPTTVTAKDGKITATLPTATIIDVVKVELPKAEVSNKGLNVDAGSVTTPIAKIDLPTVDASKKGLNIDAGGVSMPAGNLNPGPIQLSTSAVTSAINQATPIAQLIAGTASAEAMAPVDQLVGGLNLGQGEQANCVDLTSAVGLGQTADLSITAWNSAMISSSEHEGYRVNGDLPTCSGGSMPFQTLQRTVLPGTVWDASKSFGLKPGTLHFGFSGGTSESDTRTKATDLVRSAGFINSGSTRLTSWSLGGYSLYTTQNWYAGTALGAAWGQAEAQNFVLGSSSEYDTTGYVVAGFVGTVIPVTEMMRFDLRGTLSFQRTVGDAHTDSMGVMFGEHVIESADAIISGRLFGVFQEGDTVIRPFVQAGVTHHLNYSNQLEIGGVAYSLHEADTSLFTAAGVDFEINRSFQFSIGVRHDYSPDEESLTGRIGFTARFN